MFTYLTTYLVLVDTPEVVPAKRGAVRCLQTPTPTRTEPPLQASKPPPAMASESSTKPPITCHVLDTTAGKPAPSVPVTLTLLPSTGTTTTTTTTTPLQFTGTTNPDGRITHWTPTPATAPPLHTAFHAPGDQHCALTFATAAYFQARGVDTFFPEIEIRFMVRQQQKERGEHFHVPLLVSGFGYTTYRGS